MEYIHYPTKTVFGLKTENYTVMMVLHAYVTHTDPKNGGSMINDIEKMALRMKRHGAKNGGLMG